MGLLGIDVVRSPSAVLVAVAETNSCRGFAARVQRFINTGDYARASEVSESIG